MSVSCLKRRLVAEMLGTAILVMTVVGSGIMAEGLTRDGALQLIANALVTGAILIVLISVFGPISGAHFNPAVSLVFAWQGALPRNDALAYIVFQIVGGCIGTILAQAMFGLALLEFSLKARTGASQWLAEAIASFGLLLTILGGLRFRRDGIAWLVGLYITAAYWFTASTSFANPAATLARMLTNSFAGIAPADVPAFILAQLTGAFLAAALVSWLLSTQNDSVGDSDVVD